MPSRAIVATFFALIAQTGMSDPRLDPTNISPTELKAAARQVRQTLYWGEKDLATYVTVVKHLLDTALANALNDGENAPAFAERVIGLSYDLASFTWPGWNESGIEVTQELQAVGLVAARLNVKFAEQYNAPAAIRHNGYWMLGAHLLANKEPAAAKEAWMQALKFRLHDDGLGIRTWMLLADVVGGEDSEGLDENLVKLDARGAKGAQVAEQIRTARKVFRPSPPP